MMASRVLEKATYVYSKPTRMPDMHSKVKDEKGENETTQPLSMYGCETDKATTASSDKKCPNIASNRSIKFSRWDYPWLSLFDGPTPGEYTEEM